MQGKQRFIDTESLLLTDPQLAELLQLGMTKALEVQRQPGFPKPVWPGGPRCKRHVRSEVLAWALKQRDRPPESAPPSAKDRQRGTK